MLSTILNILSLLGIILLVLLGVIAAILLLILFFPICYRVKADKQPAPEDFSAGQSGETSVSPPPHADVKAWWLWGFLRARYQYPEPGALKVKLLFFTLYDSQARKNSVSDEEADFEDDTDEKPDLSGGSEEDRTVSGTGKEFRAADEASTNRTDYVFHEDSPNRSLFEKIQYTIQKFCDKIKDIYAKLKEILADLSYYKEILAEEETKELLKYTFKRLGKILKALSPRRLRANIRFGAASPDTTGYVCAIYGMICFHLGKHVVFTPDFEREIFEGDLYAAGHTTLFWILWNLLLIVKDKRLWKLRDKLNRKP